VNRSTRPDARLETASVQPGTYDASGVAPLMPDLRRAFQRDAAAAAETAATTVSWTGVATPLSLP
jgi:hypothetical protein